MKDIAVDSKTICVWLVDHSYDHAIKTLCCLELNCGFNVFLRNLSSIEFFSFLPHTYMPYFNKI